MRKFFFLVVCTTIGGGSSGLRDVCWVVVKNNEENQLIRNLLFLTSKLTLRDAWWKFSSFFYFKVCCWMLFMQSTSITIGENLIYVVEKLIAFLWCVENEGFSRKREKERASIWRVIWEKSVDDVVLKKEFRTILRWIWKVEDWNWRNVKKLSVTPRHYDS